MSHTHIKGIYNNFRQIDHRGPFLRELFHYDCFTDECLDSIHLVQAEYLRIPLRTDINIVDKSKYRHTSSGLKSLKESLWKVFQHKVPDNKKGLPYLPFPELDALKKSNNNTC